MIAYDEQILLTYDRNKVSGNHQVGKIIKKYQS